jgi:hypothetical protein
MRLRRTIFLLLAAVAAQAAEIRGRVANAVGGEPLVRVEVVLLENKTATVTSNSGEFDIPNLAPGSYTLRLNAVGYRLLTIPVTLAEATEVKEFSITMVPDNFHHTDQVEVHGDVFQIADSPATVETNLTAAEIREASTVFADDPFRAVQSLPGVSAEGNNEFFAEFSVMGAPFSSVSVYIDDVLVQHPFHEIGNFSEGASLGVLTSEVVEEMKLLPAAYPEGFGDAAGAALDVHTREGSRRGPLFRISAGIAASEILGEGALGSGRKGSWLVSGRKSYINYLIKNRVQNAADVAFEDADLRLSYDLTPEQNVSLFASDGHTNMAMNDPAALNGFEYASGNSDFTFVRAGWRWSASPRFLLEARGAYLREPDQLFNNTNLLLDKTDHREWNGSAGLSWAWAKDQVLQAGWTERQLRDSDCGLSFSSSGSPQIYSAAGTGLRQSAYMQQSWSVLQGRVHALGSLRWDSLSGFAIHPVSPQLSVAARASRSTEVQAGAGLYRQFESPPTIEVTSGLCPPLWFMPEKSAHYTAAVEQRWGENTRLRLQAFDRQDSFGLGLISGFNGGVTTSPCPPFSPLPNSTYQRDYSRGVQLILQRRSVNRLSGWLGYTFARAESRQYQVAEPVSPFHIFSDTPYYPTLDDQRHTLNAFAMYRVRPNLSLSGKFLYGTGFPVPSGTFVQLSTGQYVQVGINTERLGIYQRLDLRADKDWAFRRWKLTLYGEVLNLTNHSNRRFYYASGVDPDTGQSEVKTLQGLPITPTAGLAVQF